MSVLAAFVGGWGHAEPVLPLAQLARSRGHAITFAGQQAIVPRLAALGFETVVVGPDTLHSDRMPLMPVDREMERTVVREHFVTEFGTFRAGALHAQIERQRPDAVICDEMDVGAVVAAELTGVPCITVSVTAAGRLVSPAVVGATWDRLRTDHGLTSDSECHRLAGEMRITPAPASFRDPEVGTPFALHAVRPPILDDVLQRGGDALVYATLGTVFNVESGNLLDRLVQALAQLDTESVVTVGPYVDPSELLPGAGGRVRVEQFVPQHEVLGHCDAVVCHGGSGTLIAALSLGVPVVVLPMGADQPDNADRCEELGVGIVLDALTAEPATISAAVRAVTTESRYRHAAAALAAEAASQPPIDQLAELGVLLDPS